MKQATKKLEQLEERQLHNPDIQAQRKNLDTLIVHQKESNHKYQELRKRYSEICVISLELIDDLEKHKEELTPEEYDKHSLAIGKMIWNLCQVDMESVDKLEG